MSNFEEAFAYLLQWEGDLADDPKDRGGITKYGISFFFLSSQMTGVTHDYVRKLTLDQAKKIYLEHFWYKAPFQNIACQETCNYIFDMAVNLGLSQATKCVQRALWAFDHEFYLLIDDGIFGKKTLDALNDEHYQILPVLKSERANVYRAIVKRDPGQEKFFHGWLNRTYN